MKTFSQYLKEDFNSNGATQFMLKMASGEAPVFYEKLPKKPFNLARYIRSFYSSTAMKTLLIHDKMLRGVIFCDEIDYHVFIFAPYRLHSSVCSALSKYEGQYPKKLNYYGIYSKIYDLEDNKIIPNQWCFPFVDDDGELRTNLLKQTFDSLCTQKKLEREFMIDKESVLTGD